MVSLLRKAMGLFAVRPTTHQDSSPARDDLSNMGDSSVDYNVNTQPKELDKENAIPNRENPLRRSLKDRITRTLSNVDFENCEPELCATMLKIPSMKTYNALKRKIKKCDREWIQGLLDSGGLDSLLDCVDSLGSKRVSQLSDALLLLECVACIKAMMNSRCGLDYLIQHKDYTRKLIKGKWRDFTNK